MPVKARLELGAIIGLYDVDAEGSSAKDVVDKSDRGCLIARIVDLEHANAGAVVNGGELEESFPCAGNSLEELHIHLQSMAWLWLFVSLPACFEGPMLLICRESVQAMTTQDAVDWRLGNRLAVESLQIVGNSARAEVVMHAQVQDLADDLPWRGSGRAMWGPRPVPQPCPTVFVVAPFPFVKRLAGNPKVSTGVGHIPGACAGSLHHVQSPAA
jgi:hypothetical protein